MSTRNINIMNFAKAIKMSNKSNDYIYRKNDHDQRRYNIFFFSFFTRGDPDKETSLLPYVFEHGNYMFFR